MTGPDLQVWVYPEEIRLAGPRGLARTAAELGFGAVSVSVAYHQCMRVFPRYGSVHPGLGGGVHFDPTTICYDRLIPSTDSRAVGSEAISAFRRACDAEGLAFRAWLVVLDHEPLAAAHPALAAQTLDGTPTMHALCPSHPEVRDYAAALVTDISHQFSPDLIDLEAALYPRWNGYVAEVSLSEISQDTKRYGAQCLCEACCRLLAHAGVDRATAREGLLRAAGPPLDGVGAEYDADLVDSVSDARDRGVEQLVENVRDRVAPTTKLRLLGFGSPLDARLQGLGRRAAAAADGILLGLGPLSGELLMRELDAHLAIHCPATTAVGLNWTPARDGRSLGLDALTILGRGMAGISFYNLSLIPEAGFSDIRTAVSMARAGGTT